MASKGAIVLEVKDVCKNFGVTIALNHVNFTLKSGEIRGLIGENGSGKSTVSSIVAGMQKPTSGEMTYNGKSWTPANTLEAQANGICMIVQEAGTIPSIPVADNVFLGHEELFARGPFVNHAKMVKQAQVLLDELGIPIDASIRTGQLDLQQCKLIEIAKAMYWKPKILIVDETTTALSQTGRELLYKLLSYPRTLFTKRQLIDDIWDLDSDVDEHTVEVYISRLREKFRDNPDFELRTIRGFGYMGMPREDGNGQK